MKKILTIALLAAATGTASAQSFDYLTARLANGKEQSISTKTNVKITFENNQIVITNSAGEKFTANLEDMGILYFASTPTSIKELEQQGYAASIVNGTLHVTAPEGSPVSVYTADGKKVGTTGLTNGIYIVRIGNKGIKVLAK